MPCFPLGCPASGIWQGGRVPLRLPHLQGEGRSLLLSRPSHLFSLAGWCRVLLPSWAPCLQASRLPHLWGMAGWHGSSILSRQPCLCALVRMPAPLSYTSPLEPCRLPHLGICWTGHLCQEHPSSGTPQGCLVNLAQKNAPPPLRLLCSQGLVWCSTPLETTPPLKPSVVPHFP